MAISVQIDKLNKAFGSIRALDDVTLPIETGEKKHRIDEALERVRMSDRADHKPNELSD